MGVFIAVATILRRKHSLFFSGDNDISYTRRAFPTEIKNDNYIVKNIFERGAKCIVQFLILSLI